MFFWSLGGGGNLFRLARRGVSFCACVRFLFFLLASTLMAYILAGIEAAPSECPPVKAIRSTTLPTESPARCGHFRTRKRNPGNSHRCCASRLVAVKAASAEVRELEVVLIARLAALVRSVAWALVLWNNVDAALFTFPLVQLAALVVPAVGAPSVVVPRAGLPLLGSLRHVHCTVRAVSLCEKKDWNSRASE